MLVLTTDFYTISIKRIISVSVSSTCFQSSGFFFCKPTAMMIRYAYHTLNASSTKDVIYFHAAMRLAEQRPYTKPD